MIQLLANSVDNGVDAGDEAASQAAVLNNLASAETCVFFMTIERVCSAFAPNLFQKHSQYTAPNSTTEKLRTMRRRYTAKLRDDLDAFSKEVFQLPSDRERVQSILQDLNKTSRDFYAIGGRAVEQLSGLLIARVR